MITFSMLAFSLLILLLIAAVILVINIRKSIKEINLQQTIHNEEMQALIVDMGNRYNQQYSDIITELVNYKEGVLSREDDDSDQLYEAAKIAVVTAGKASTSYIQRALGVGYSRAAKLMDMLEENEVIGPANGSSPRLIIVEDIAEDEDGGVGTEVTEEMYGMAKNAVIEMGKASTSFIQRKLGIGYATAAKIMDMLEQREVVGPADGSKPRKVMSVEEVV